MEPFNPLIPTLVPIATIHTSDVGKQLVLIGHIEGVPADTADVYAPSAQIHDIENGDVYLNKGTSSSPDFEKVAVVSDIPTEE